MSTSLFSMATDQNPNEILRNTHLFNSSGGILKETQKSRGRRPGTKTGQQKQKKPCLRGMGIAKMEKLIEEEEKKKIAAASGDTSATPNPNKAACLLPVDPVVVLQGFPSSLGGCRSNRIYCGGAGSGQIMIDPWRLLETSTHELSSVPNLQMYNASNTHCDTCFKKNEDQNNVVRSNSGGFSKYTMIPPMNGYDHLLQQDQRSQGFFFDHTISKSSATASDAITNPNLHFTQVTNHTVSMEEFSSYMERNPRNGSGKVKEYEFFPGKYDDFAGNYSKAISSVGNCSPNTSSSTIDLSLKL